MPHRRLRIQAVSLLCLPRRLSQDTAELYCSEIFPDRHSGHDHREAWGDKQAVVKLLEIEAMI